LKTHKTIADTIYGRIDITETEFELLHSPLLQRLRHISQTPGACFVFPSATHNRFAHSLGCLYMIDQMAQSLGLEGSDRHWLRCAALLHDVGHFPLSHTGETVYTTLGQTHADAFRARPDDAHDAFVWAGQASAPPSTPSHETMSALVMRQNPSLRQLLEGRSLPVESMASVVTGELTGRPDAPVFNAMVRSELDADRMDYLVRDATLVGAKYGLIDADYLLKNLRQEEGDGGKQVAVSLAGLHSLEHALLSRFFMYCNVFYHKTVLAFDLLMRAVMKLLLDERLGVLPPSLDAYSDMIGADDDRALLSFTDNAFWGGVSEAVVKGSPRLQKLASMLLRRNGPKCAYQDERFVTTDDVPGWRDLQVLKSVFGDDRKRKRLAEAAGIGGNDLTLVVTPIKLLRADELGVKLVDPASAPPRKLLTLGDMSSSILGQHVGEVLYRVCVFVLEDPPYDKHDTSSPRNRVSHEVRALLDRRQRHARRAESD
jgi:HD superfamily phosphohydrolase